MLSACDLPSDRARLPNSLPTTTTMGGRYLLMAPPGCLANGSMAPTLAHHGAETPSLSSESPLSLACPAPFHPQQSMGGSQEGLMAPLLTQSGAEKPSTSLATPSALACLTMPPTCPSGGALCTPSPPNTTGGGATMAEHCAATTLFCWVQRTWLRCWFHQQQRKHFQTLFRGAFVSVWGNRQPPPTLTKKTSNPKVLRHPFRDCGLPLPRRRQAQQHNHPRCCPG
jgi:hypothetical protein